MAGNIEITDYLGTIVLATGALGVAAAGIVDGLKMRLLGHTGFQQLRDMLGAPLWQALDVAYGPQGDKLMREQYRDGGAKGELPKTLRQGIRIGLTPDNAREIAGDLGVVKAEVLAKAATAIVNGQDLDNADRAAVGRFELAADARIQAGLSLAEARYAAAARCAASWVALILALLTAAALQCEAGAFDLELWLGAVLAGLAAVPLAPIAKDVASGIQAASKVLKRRG